MIDNAAADAGAVIAVCPESDLPVFERHHAGGASYFAAFQQQLHHLLFSIGPPPRVRQSFHSVMGHSLFVHL